MGKGFRSMGGWKGRICRLPCKIRSSVEWSGVEKTEVMRFDVV